MYKKILVTLESTPTDRAIIEHIKKLGREMQSHLVLLHVVTSAPAKYHGANAGDRKSVEGLAYLQKVQQEFVAEGIPTDIELAYGNPAKEIIRWVRREGCDLVAMSTHGHKFMADLVFGTTAICVQHCVSVPVLMLRAK